MTRLKYLISRCVITSKPSKISVNLKDLNSTVAEKGSVFIVLMTDDGAIWFRYQRAVLMR